MNGWTKFFQLLAICDGADGAVRNITDCGVPCGEQAFNELGAAAFANNSWFNTVRCIEVKKMCLALGMPYNKDNPKTTLAQIVLHCKSS